jgi:bis(5'-nucleosyl)-tetraphosphatase (symmetrical)
MARYIIGDVHGCLKQLENLLDKIQFNCKEDHLYFVGDLVNRGPQSLETLRFIKSLKSTTIVLGNHDLHLIAMAYGITPCPATHLLHPIIHSKYKIELIEWLRHQPIIHSIDQQHIVVHAGIPPQLPIDTILKYTNQIHDVLTGDNIQELLTLLYQDFTVHWDDTLSHWQSLQYITLALTQIRQCSKEGTLEIKFKQSSLKSETVKPWFQWYHQPQDIIFGHWAALKGETGNKQCTATDTGCVWGYQLSAYTLDTDTFQRVSGSKQGPKTTPSPITRDA